PTQDRHTAPAGSVPADGLGVAPGTARSAVPAGDVVQAPGDLGGRVGPPVRARGGHLRPGQRLWDAVGTGGGVLRVRVPVALPLPERVQAAPLVRAPAAGGQQLLSDRARVGARVVTGRGAVRAVVGRAGGARGAGRVGGARGAGRAGGAGAVRAALGRRRGGTHEHHLVDRFGDQDLGLHLAGDLFTVAVLRGVGDHPGAVLPLGLHPLGAAGQGRGLPTDSVVLERLGLGAVLGTDPLDGDVRTFGGPAVHLHRDVVLQADNNAVLDQGIGHGLGIGLDVVGLAVHRGLEVHSRTGLVQQPGRVPAVLPAAGGLVPQL